MNTEFDGYLTVSSDSGSWLKHCVDGYGGTYTYMAHKTETESDKWLLRQNTLFDVLKELF